MNRRLVLCTIVIISLFTIFSFEGTESRHVKAKSGDGARVVELASNATVSCAPPCDEEPRRQHASASLTIVPLSVVAAYHTCGQFLLTAYFTDTDGLKNATPAYWLGIKIEEFYEFWPDFKDQKANIVPRICDTNCMFLRMSREFEMGYEDRFTEVIYMGMCEDPQKLQYFKDHACSGATKCKFDSTGMVDFGRNLDDYTDELPRSLQVTSDVINKEQNYTLFYCQSHYCNVDILEKFYPGLEVHESPQIYENRDTDVACGVKQ
ncbi:hypothetical protein QR680_006117 [Steinernema hermaphroditum]|uniref:Uncharacterized protein n=1 Tax=Steinernema hermaphroditum TaxID=289476 RepID=A0AA39HWK3_9BILA|nr:hypothetical protein QR680_006117 [Steinernema hermaphroditum]